MARVPEGADTTMAAPRKEKEGFEPLRATVEQMGMGIAQVSLDGKWLMVSHRLCEILGYCENELLQTSFEIFFRLPHFLANPRGHKYVPAEDIAGPMIEDRVTRQDGATIWLRTVFLRFGTRARASHAPFCC